VLAKDCTFKAVTAVQYKEEMIKDAFINGLASANFKQHILKIDDISLDQAFEMALSLDHAFQQSCQYTCSQLSATTVCSSKAHKNLENSVTLCPNKTVLEKLMASCPYKVRLDKSTVAARETTNVIFVEACTTSFPDALQEMQNATSAKNKDISIRFVKPHLE